MEPPHASHQWFHPRTSSCRGYDFSSWSRHKHISWSAFRGFHWKVHQVPMETPHASQVSSNYGYTLTCALHLFRDQGRRSSKALWWLTLSFWRFRSCEYSKLWWLTPLFWLLWNCQNPCVVAPCTFPMHRLWGHTAAARDGPVHDLISWVPQPTKSLSMTHNQITVPDWCHEKTRTMKGFIIM